jgi:hypothetical protein
LFFIGLLRFLFDFFENFCCVLPYPLFFFCFVLRLSCIFSDIDPNHPLLKNNHIETIDYGYDFGSYGCGGLGKQKMGGIAPLYDGPSDLEDIDDDEDEEEEEEGVMVEEKGKNNSIKQGAVLVKDNDDDEYLYDDGDIKEKNRGRNNTRKSGGRKRVIPKREKDYVMYPSDRGSGFFFGGGVTRSFCEENGVELIIRSHQLKLEGF